jgi:anti-sigma regulatory factor (Ser/Thr protein kinase)
MPRLEHAALTRTITADAIKHPADLATMLASRHAVTRGTMNKALKRLVEAGWLTKQGVRRATYQPGVQREVTNDYALDGLDEHSPWMRDILPVLSLGAPVAKLAQHIFGELLNNAIDHSGGTAVTVSVRQTPTHLHLLITDNGLGIFTQLAAKAGLPDAQRAALELAKGRLTTLPECHGGRGIFFVARMVDAMNLQSNGQALQWRRHAESVQFRAHPLNHTGTTVFCSIRLDTDVRPTDAYSAFGSEDAPLDFSRTQVPMRLLTDGGLSLDSRAQARWVVSRLELFATAELDFEGVEDIGPSFIDEVFRVWHSAHPDVRLEPVKASERVSRMLKSAR